MLIKQRILVIPKNNVVLVLILILVLVILVLVLVVLVNLLEVLIKK